MNRQTTALLTFVLVLFSCTETPHKPKTEKAPTAAAEPVAEVETSSKESEQPLEINAEVTEEVIEILDEKTGDLDKDGIPERVVAYEIDKGPEGSVRGLKIFRKKNGSWKEAYNAVGPVLTFEQVMLIGGDPFKGIDIERGAIVVHHYGVGYSFTHRYRCNAGRWEVIGATVIYETRTVDQDKTDFNLLTGKVECRHIYFYPDEEEDGDENSFASYYYKYAKLPEMNGFVPTFNEVKIPGSGVTFGY